MRRRSPRAGHRAEILEARPAVAPGGRAGSTPAAACGLCPSSVASGQCKAQALQGSGLLLGPIPVGPSSPAPPSAALSTPPTLISAPDEVLGELVLHGGGPGIELRPMTLDVTLHLSASSGPSANFFQPQSCIKSQDASWLTPYVCFHNISI